MKPSAAELIANNAIHAGVVLPADPGVSLEDGSGMLRVEMNGIEMARVTEEQSLVTVMNSLGWLVQELAEHGIDLEAGAGGTLWIRGRPVSHARGRPGHGEHRARRYRCL